MSVKITMEDLQARLEALENEVSQLKANTVKKTAPESTRTMTEDDAFRIMTGDHKDKSHKEAAESLGLSYGQIYSCRLEFTFKAVHHKLSKTEGYRNPWIKARS